MHLYVLRATLLITVKLVCYSEVCHFEKWLSNVYALLM